MYAQHVIAMQMYFCWLTAILQSGFLYSEKGQEVQEMQNCYEEKNAHQEKQTGWSTGVYNSENIETISILTIIISKAVFKKLSVEI